MTNQSGNYLGRRIKHHICLRLPVIMTVLCFLVMFMFCPVAAAAEQPQLPQVSSSAIVWAFIGLSGAIMIVTLVMAFFTVQHEKKRNELFEEMKEAFEYKIIRDLEESINKKIERKLSDLEHQSELLKKRTSELEEEHNRRLDKLKDDFKENAEELVKQGMEKGLDQRNLAMENVRFSQWVIMAPRMKQALKDNNVEEFFALWEPLIKSRNALRQMFSQDDSRVFDGLGFFMRLADAQNYILEKETFWKLICLLHEQKRFSGDNIPVVHQLGKLIGKTLADCNELTKI